VVIDFLWANISRNMPRLMFRTDHRYVLSEMKFIR
jgi:hypothetical protein